MIEVARRTKIGKTIEAMSPRLSESQSQYTNMTKKLRKNQLVFGRYFVGKPFDIKEIEDCIEEQRELYITAEV